MASKAQLRKAILVAHLKKRHGGQNYDNIDYDTLQRHHKLVLMHDAHGSGVHAHELSDLSS